MVKVYQISAVTLIIKNMERSCNFYSKIPGFKLVYGGSCDDTFTTYEIGEYIPKMCLNLELNITNNNHTDKGLLFPIHQKLSINAFCCSSKNHELEKHINACVVFFFVSLYQSRTLKHCIRNLKEELLCFIIYMCFINRRAIHV